MNFNFETTGIKKSSAHDFFLSKKYAIFLRFIVIFEPIKTLDAKKRKNVAYFAIKVRAHSSSSNHFFSIENH